MFVVCAYGQIVAQHVLDAVETVVVHPSLVPHWRGAAPVERALMAGETELGVCTLQMTAAVDEGPIGDARPVHVPRDADAGRAYELLAPAAVDGVAATLDGIAAGTVVWRAQQGGASYAAKIGPDDKVIDWTRPAVEIVDQVRALSPHIGAVTELLGRRTLIWRASAGDGPVPEPGPDRLVIAAGDGWVDVLELQQEGRTRMTAAEFLRGAGRACRRCDRRGEGLGGAGREPRAGGRVRGSAAPADRGPVSTIRRRRCRSCPRWALPTAPSPTSWSSAPSSVAGRSTRCSAPTPRRRSRAPTRTCSTRCASPRSSCSSSIACPPTPSSTTP